MMQPDVQAATVEILGDLMPEERVFSRLTPGFENDLPAVLVIASQDDSEILAEHTITFEVYHSDLPSARTLTRLITAHLSNGQHGTTAGLIDEYWVDVQPREVPYSNPDVVQFNFTMKAATRPV